MNVLLYHVLKFIEHYKCKIFKQFLKMGACDTWDIEINILVNEYEVFSLPFEFHFNNWRKV